MFTKIELKNFKSFSDLTFNLLDRKGNPKTLALIYGENGAGKSNIAASFLALKELLRTMDVRDMLQSILEGDEFRTNSKLMERIEAQLNAQIHDVAAIARDYKMIDADGNMSLKFDFIVNKKLGSYYIEFDDSEIIHERLEYVLEKNRTTYFDIEPQKRKFNDKIFTSKVFMEDVGDLTEKFWGKHSFLAILTHEAQDKSGRYIKESISANFFAVLSCFENMSCSVKIGDNSTSLLGTPYAIFYNLENGSIQEKQKGMLLKAEKMLTSFFGAINSDIQRVYYKIDSDGNNKITYQLFFIKKICGKLRHISFEQESTGNHQVLALLSYLMSALFGGIVVIDELDTGVHDLLIQKILSEMAPMIEGQLIATTHNTLLMECPFAREATYIMSEDEDANKYVRCVTDSEERIYQKTNIRNKYMDGTYDGIPKLDHIDFRGIKELFKIE